VVAALLVAFLVKVFLVQAFYIPSGSMEPTLKPGDRVLVDKISYDLHSVHRGDIVVFKRPPNDNSPGVTDLIKRVIGLPGETIQGIGGAVYIDGRQLNESWLPKGVATAPFPLRVIPKNEVFVMGDNRGDSADSRVFGPISENLIIGRAFVRVWPITAVHFFF
jgi:signal peptidase I